jgi:hypothetical protein
MEYILSNDCLGGLVLICSPCSEDGMIEKAQLVEMFEGMRAQAPWDVDSDLLWGYFFTGEDRDVLNRLSEKLVSLSYRLVEIRPDENEPGFWLHVERVETYSPDSLHERNQELYRMADEYSVNYDGMDVGPAQV